MKGNNYLIQIIVPPSVFFVSWCLFPVSLNSDKKGTLYQLEVISVFLPEE
jgi:hypothetical protein